MRLPRIFRRKRDDNAAMIERLYGGSDIEVEFNLKPLGIPAALRSELVIAAAVILAKSAWEPDYISEIEDGEPLPDTPGNAFFMALIDDPNPTMGFEDLMARLLASLAIMGRCYLVRGRAAGLRTTSPVVRQPREHAGAAQRRRRAGQLQRAQQLAHAVAAGGHDA